MWWKWERVRREETRKEMTKRTHSSTCTGHIFSGNSRNTLRWLQDVKPAESRWIRALQKKKQFSSQCATFSLAHALLLTFSSVWATDRMISALFFSLSLTHFSPTRHCYGCCFISYAFLLQPFFPYVNNRAVCLQIEWRRRACCWDHWNKTIGKRTALEHE